MMRMIWKQSQSKNFSSLTHDCINFSTAVISKQLRLYTSYHDGPYILETSIQRQPHSRDLYTMTNMTAGIMLQYVRRNSCECVNGHWCFQFPSCFHGKVLVKHKWTNNNSNKICPYNIRKFRLLLSHGYLLGYIELLPWTI